MGYRRVKITDIERATGISHKTLTAIYYERTTMFRADVVEKLCRYFSIGVGDLLYVSDREQPE